MQVERDVLTVGPDTARPKGAWKATRTPGSIEVHCSELERGCLDTFFICAIATETWMSGVSTAPSACQRLRETGRVCSKMYGQNDL